MSRYRRSGNPVGHYALLSAFMLATGCATDEQPATETAVQSQAAIGESEVSPAFSMSIQLPAGADVQKVAVAGLNRVALADRVQVSNAVASTGSASSGAVVETGTDSRTGPITSYGNVVLRDRARVTGDVTAAGAIQPGNSVVVSGAVTPNATLQAVTTLAWNVSVPGPNLGPISLEPDRTQDIAPGRYAVGSVKSRSSLTLHSGVYYFDSLTIEPQGKLLIDDARGPVQIYLGNSFTYRGEIRPATIGIPKLLIGVRGTGGVMIEAPFTGVIVAPLSKVSLQAARPNGHRGAFFGKTLNLEPDTIVGPYAFEWPTVVGGTVNPDIPDTNPHTIVPSVIDQIASTDPTSPGPITVSSNPGKPVPFTLPEDQTVNGGLIGNGTMQMSCTTPAGETITCTYQGQSSTAVPTTPEELVKGRILKFVSCSDGKPASATRQCTTFATTVNPAPGLPVTLSTPMREVGACHERVDVISALQTYELRKNFNWANVSPVAETDPAGKPALYYAWVYLRNREEQLNLKKLWIHQLSRPLFTSELDSLAGKCGSFVNPGDGEGFMVPVVILGKTYNRLKQVQSRNDISGDKVMFDAVILRDVPAEARNPNGSIKLDVLKNAHFVYLPYEKRPLPATSDIVFEGGASKSLLDAASWVAAEVKDATEMVTNGLGYIDKWLRGTTTVNLQLSAITQDPAFVSAANPKPIMHRAWGDTAGQKLGAPGLQVEILQKFLGSFIPETSAGRTGANGNVAIDAVSGGSTRGATGLCIELANDAAKIVGDSIFFLPEEICDFRAFKENDPNGTGTPADFKLEIKSEPQAVHIENTMLTGLYEADDTYRYGKRVVGISAKQARIITGYWAETISPTLENDTRKGVNTFCLNYPNAISDAALATAVTVGAFAGSAIGPIGSVLGGLSAAYISLHIGNADIVMPTNSMVPVKRAVMSHEMGHYMFCSLLQEQYPDAINWLVISTIINSNYDTPVRYLNEAAAEFFTGQVAGAADYRWAEHAAFVSPSGSDTFFCTPENMTGVDATPRCWETNLTNVAEGSKDAGSIGRIVTMLYDAADISNSPRETVGVQTGDAWRYNSPTTPEYLVYSDSGYLKSDFENVSIGNSGIRDFGHRIAEHFHGLTGLAEAVSLLGGGTLSNILDGMSRAASVDATIASKFDDAKLYRALNDTMRSPEHGAYNWCDRCSVLATHKRNGTAATDWSAELFKQCQDDPLLAGALDEAPPDPALNINRTTCTACPTGTVHNADYSDCVPCSTIVVGDKCEACAPDVVIAGASLVGGTTFTFGSDTPQPDGDNCPNVLWVEVTDVDALFAAFPESLTASVAWPPVSSTAAADCQRSHTLYKATQTGTDPFVYSTTQANGTWHTCAPGSTVCLEYCSGYPQVTIDSSGNTVKNLMVGIPTGGTDSLTISTPTFVP